MTILYRLYYTSYIQWFPELIFYFSKLIKNDLKANHENLTYRTIIFLLLSSGLMSLVQNLVAFSVMANMTTVSFSVASATKRVAVIVVSILMLKNPVTRKFLQF